MRFPVTAAVVFATALAVGLAWRKAAPHTEIQARKEGSEPPASPKRTKAGETLLSSVRAALRAGDMGRARQLLAEAADKDPQGFFVVLSHLPHIDGWDDLIARAGAAMAWNEPESKRLLNGVLSPLWRDAAWEAYAGARVGKLPDEEVYKVGICANRYRWTAGIETLLKDGAEKRPVEMMALLNRMGGTSVREAFCELVMKTHPELAGELFRSIPDGSPGANYDRGYFLQAQVMGLPTAKNIMSAISEAGPRALTTVNNLVNWSYSKASPEERQQLRQEIANQPDDLRAAMITGAVFSTDSPVPLEEFAGLLSLSKSGRQQQNALSSWMEHQPDLDPSDRGWIEQLPTEKLRAKANEILDRRIPQAGP